jgi:transposase
MDRKTIRKYLRAAVQAGASPREQRSVEELTAFARRHFPEAADTRRRSRRSEELDRHRDFIREGLRENRMSTVHRRLVERTGLAVSVATFRRYVHAAMPEALDTGPMPIWRPEVEPGEEAQADFGYMGPWEDPVTGRRRRVYAFILVLSYSRHMFVRLVLRLDGLAWQECHIEALAFFGAVPRRIVLDNLKDGVVKPDLYDPKLNRSYAELAAHYGFLVDPARLGHPKDKSRVERPYRYVRDSFWRGERFLNLEAMNRAAVGWCRDVAGPRIHGTTHRKPLEVYETEEQPAMACLPERPFERCVWTMAKVGPDAHCSVSGALYSVPHIHRSRSLDVRVTDRLVEFYQDGNLVKTHLRRYDRGRTTDYADLPPDRVAFFEHTPQWCLSRAREMGPNVSELMRRLLAVQTLTHLRQAQGIVRLEQSYGKERLDAACARALAFGDPAYRTVKRILVAAMDVQTMPEPARGAQTGAYLRGTGAFTLDTTGR